MGIFRSHKNTRRISRLFLLLMVFWQGAVLHHMTVTPHAADSAANQTLQWLNGPQHGPVSATFGDDRHDRNHSNTPVKHHCQFLDSITCANVFVTPTTVVWKVSLCVVDDVSVHIADTNQTPQSVLDYAPSTSPPAPVLG